MRSPRLAHASAVESIFSPNNRASSRRRLRFSGCPDFGIVRFDERDMLGHERAKGRERRVAFTQFRYQQRGKIRKLERRRSAETVDDRAFRTSRLRVTKFV